MNQSQNPILFDSVILAGGFGKRLSPLTDKIPKPMLPIASKSAFSRNIGLIRQSGFMNTAVTTMYLPEQIENQRSESGSLVFFREKNPLGSAGALSVLKGKTEDCILIISGDSIFDFDLKSAKREFLESGCDAAMVLCRNADIGEYGSVCVQNKHVVSFCEKPSPRDTLSDLINTGIYFITKKALELIPENRFFDFAHDLFPEMLRRNMDIYALTPNGHWFDIGSFGEYHRCNMWVSNGENCFGEHISLHPGARIEYSVIFNNCTIGDSVIRGAIIADNVTIGNDCIIPPGCVIGSGVEIRDGSVLAPGTIVETGKTILGEAFVEMFPKQSQNLILDDDFVIADETDEGYFVRLGRILGGEGSVVAFAEGSGITLQQSCELACGAAEAGSRCTVISGGTPTLAAFSAREYEARCAFISRSGDKTTIRLFSKSGMPFSREELRAVSSKIPKISKLAGSVYLLPHGTLIKRYLAFLKDHTVLPKKLNIANGTENKLLREVCEEFGIEKSEQSFEIRLSADGEKASVIFPDGNEISYWQLILIYCLNSDRKSICLPRDTPTTVESILTRHSTDIHFYGDSESPERKLAETDFIPRDGVLLALAVCSIAEKSGKSIKELSRELPPFSVRIRAIYADRSNIYSIIARLRENDQNHRNAGFDFGDGRVNVYPSASGKFRLIAEAVDFETAEEISLKAIDLIEKQKEK